MLHGTRDLGIDLDRFHPTISPPTTYPYGGSNTPRFGKSIATGESSVLGVGISAIVAHASRAGVARDVTDTARAW